jgi:hypothetical protein
MKLHEIRCHFQEESHRRARGDRRDYLKFSFSAFSHRGVGYIPYGFRLVELRAYSSERPEAANSAVNYYVSCSIRPAVFLPAAGLAPETFFSAFRLPPSLRGVGPSGPYGPEAAFRFLIS